MMAQVSDRLKEAMETNANEYYQVKVIFNSPNNIMQQRNQWQQQGVPVSAWPRMVNRVLMRNANASQKEAKRVLNEAGKDLKTASSFYIVNMMIIEAKPNLIYQLYQLQDVSYIDLADEEWELIEPVSVGTPDQLRHRRTSVNHIA